MTAQGAGILACLMNTQECQAPHNHRRKHPPKDGAAKRLAEAKAKKDGHNPRYVKVEDLEQCKLPFDQCKDPLHWHVDSDLGSYADMPPLVAKQEAYADYEALFGEQGNPNRPHPINHIVVPPAQADEKEAASDGVDNVLPPIPTPSAPVRQDNLPLAIHIPACPPVRLARLPPLPIVLFRRYLAHRLWWHALLRPIHPSPSHPVDPPPASPPPPPHLKIPAARDMLGRAAVIKGPQCPQFVTQLGDFPDVQDYLITNPECSVAYVSILYREADAEQTRTFLRGLADIFTMEVRLTVTESLAVTPYRFLSGDLSLDSKELRRCPVKRTILGCTVWTDPAPTSATAVWLNTTYAYHRHQWIIVPLARHLLRQRSTLMRKVYDSSGKTLDSVFQNLRQLATADDTPSYWRTHLPMWEATLAYVANQVCILGARTRLQHTESGVPVFRLH